MTQPYKSLQRELMTLNSVYNDAYDEAARYVSREHCLLCALYLYDVLRLFLRSAAMTLVAVPVLIFWAAALEGPSIGVMMAKNPQPLVFSGTLQTLCLLVFTLSAMAGLLAGQFGQARQARTCRIAKQLFVQRMAVARGGGLKASTAE